jgi:L-iditol 2-dehydrogenase
MEYAAELIAPGQFRVRDVSRRNPDAGEVKVAVSACGVCGSDMQRFRGTGRQRYPIVLGHEISGTVSAVGPGVQEIREGDAVAVIPLIPCFQCAWCRQGEYGLCAQYTFVGSRQAGGFASTVMVPAGNLVRVPDGVELQSGVLVEPLAVGSHALTCASLTRADTLAILGGGSIGLCAAMIARCRGVERICVWDVSADRTAHAETLGIDARLVVDGDDQSFAADVVVEAAGSPAALRSALHLAKAKGRIACVGTTQKDLHVPADEWEQLLRKQLTLVGVWNSYAAPFPGAAWSTALSALANDPVRTGQLITHRFRLNEIQTCFDWILDHPGQYGKIILCP